jgi:hypothetical protein
VKDYHAFIFWYIKATTDLQNDGDINERITDRSKDGGSDSVIIDSITKTVKIIQSKYTPNIGDTPYNKDELNKLNKVCEYLLGEADYEDLREYIHKGLKDKLDVAVRLIKEENYQLKPIFITTHRENPNYKLFVNKDLPPDIIASKEIEIKYYKWLNGHTPELGELDFAYIGLMEGPHEPKSFLVNMNSNELRKKYRLYKDKLFSRNVRIYQEKYKPNKSIKGTLTNHPNNFWYFNNGITILTERITLKSDDQVIILKNPQIINGCQTVTTIGENKESDACLFIKIVEIEDDILNQNLIDGIIQANNRQTPVDERMLKSNHPLQVKIQKELEDRGYYYERKEGQYNEEKVKLKRINNLQLIKNIDIIKAKISIVKSPNFSFSKEDDLFSTNFEDVFKSSNCWIDYLIPYLLWKWIDRIGRGYNRGKARKNFHRISSWYILRIIYDNNSDLKNFTKTSDILKFLESKDADYYISSTIRNLIDIAFKVYQKSGYNGGYGEQRDFLKSKDAYSLISKSINHSLRKEIEIMFD